MVMLGLPVHVPGDSECSQFPGEGPGGRGVPYQHPSSHFKPLHHHVFLLAPLAGLFLGLSTSPRIPSTLTTECISFASWQSPYKLPRTIRVDPRV